MDGRGTLVEVISQSDLVEYELATERELTVEAPFYRQPYDDALDPSRGFQIEELSADTVNDVMTPFLVTVAEGTPTREAAARMARASIHRLIVVDEDQQLRGIVTSRKGCYPSPGGRGRGEGLVRLGTALGGPILPYADVKTAIG